MEPVQYKIKDLAGMAALSRLGQDLLNSALDKGETEEDFWSALADLVSKLGQVDWEKRKDNPGLPHRRFCRRKPALQDALRTGVSRP